MDLTVFSAKTAATETAAFSIRKPLRLAHIATVGVAQARPLELVALRLACPPFHHQRTTHFCTKSKRYL